MYGHRNPTFAFCCLLAATGCGGSGDKGDLGTTRPPPGLVIFGDLVDQADSLTDDWQGVALSDPAGLPVSGSASYGGVMQATVETGGSLTDLAGTLDMVVNFPTSAVSGGVSGIYDGDGQAYGGALTLANGALDRGADTTLDYTFAADLAGTLSGAGDAIAVSAYLAGDFHGASQQAVAGAITGSATSDAGTGLVYGGFIAAR